MMEYFDGGRHIESELCVSWTEQVDDRLREKVNRNSEVRTPPIASLVGIETPTTRSQVSSLRFTRA